MPSAAADLTIAFRKEQGSSGSRLSSADDLFNSKTHRDAGEAGDAAHATLPARLQRRPHLPLALQLQEIHVLAAADKEIENASYKKL